MKNFTVLLLLSLVFAGCPKLEEPPTKVLPASLPQVETSVISIPLEAKLSDVRNIIWNELSSLRINEDQNKLKIRNGYFSHLNLDMDGNNIALETRFQARFEYHIKKWLKLKCDVSATVKTNGSINVGDNVNIVLDMKSSGNSLKLHKVCNKFFAKAASLVKFFFRKRVSKLIAEKANEAIARNRDKLTFKNKVINSVNKFSEPLKIANNVWLTPNAEKIVYSNLFEQNGYIKFNVAAYAKPQLTYSTSKPNYDPKTFNSVEKVSTINPKSIAVADLRFPYDEGEKLVTPILQKFAKEKFSWLLYKPGKVKFFPSGNKLAISLQILRKVNDSELITLYLTGLLAYNKAKEEIYLKDLDFTTASSSAVLQFVSAVAKEEILKKISEVAKFSVKKQKTLIDNTIKNISKTFSVITKDDLLVEGNFSKVDVTNLFVAKEDVGAYAKTAGQIKVSYNYSTRSNISYRAIEEQPLQQILPKTPCLDCDNDYYDGDIDIDLDSGEIINYTGSIPPTEESFIFDREEVITNVYPNPTRDLLHIESSKKVKEVFVYNNSGVLIGRYINLVKIDVSQYPKGIYILKIISNDNSEETQNFIKE